ncbi:MAG: winged helix-turn-helix domain-containing protein [Granulosicoccaceae bacterium]|jgi:TolB-like protein/DNA-binding winged helix-turn-helix (wHTH) protein
MQQQAHTGFYLEDWQVSPSEGLLSRGDEIVHLEPKAMEVLVYFASHPGEVITREALERDVWHGAVIGYDAVTNTVIKLRKALQDNARQPRFIATIPKRGYQLIAPVSYLEDESANTPSPRPNMPAANAAQPQRRAGMVMAALAAVSIIALVFGLVWLWPSSPSPNKPVGPATADNSVVPPSIVVLPFENLSEDQKQEYLADGITEDIITDLSRLSNILVIASNTSFKYKGKPVLLEEVAADLDVEFVLQGSIRRVGEAVRVNARLVNAKTGFNTWAQRYDRNIAELFAVQDEVTHSIAKALAVKITTQEKTRLAQKTTDSLKAYDFFQEGKRIFQGNTKETSELAREMYRKAIELDPGYGRAYGAMAFSLAEEFRRGWTGTPVETLDRALVLARQAVALDESAPQTHFALGFVHLMRKEYASAEKAATQSLTVAPNYADGYGLLALIKANLGQPEQAIEINTRAMRLNPYYTWNYLYTQGSAHYMRGDYEAAITTLEQAQARNENVVQVKLFLAASYMKAGRQDDAEWITDQLEILSPTATLTEINRTIPIADPEIKRTLLADLRKAGLPE